jgi:hypothetical protein
MTLNSVHRIVRTFTLLLITVPTVQNCDQTPTEYRDFLRMSPAEREEKMRGLPIDKQIDYYLAGTSYAHPPLTELGDVIAEQGETAVPFLVKRLRNETSESRQVDLIYVLRQINERGFSLRDNKEVVDLLKTTVARLTNHKQVGERLVADIMNNPRTDLQRLKDAYPTSFPSPNREP